jgi:hypothetical protein
MIAAKPAAAVSAVLTVMVWILEGGAEDDQHGQVIIDNHQSRHSLLFLGVHGLSRSLIP